MQLSYCDGSVAAIVSCEKGRHVEGTPLLRWSTAPLFVTFPVLTRPLLRPTIPEDRNVAS